MLITLRYTVTIVIGTIGFGYFVSLLLLQMKKQNVYLSVLFFPHLLMSVVGCILWEQIYNGFLPSIGKSLGLSLIRRNLLAQKDTAIFAVAIADLWRLVPYAILLIFTSLRAVSLDLIDTAEMEGANKFQILWHVQLPQTLSTLGIILTTAVTHGLTAIDTILIMTGGGPARATETLYFVVYKNSFMRQKFGYGLAQGVILALLSVLIFVLIDMTLNRKRMDGVEIV
jgi:raffinose/stachyose/melibiose transport system permease protein